MELLRVSVSCLSTPRHVDCPGYTPDMAVRNFSSQFQKDHYKPVPHHDIIRGSISWKSDRWCYLAGVAAAEFGAPCWRPEHGSWLDSFLTSRLQLLQPACRLCLLPTALTSVLDDIIDLIDYWLLISDNRAAATLTLTDVNLLVIHCYWLLISVQ